jgi:thiol-disulfide isomerase/thioredoxin
VAKADRVSGIILAGLVIAAFALVLRTVIGIASGPVPPRSGAHAPAIAAKTPGGAPIALTDLKDRVVLVDFWATWCPPCVASMPALETLQRDLGGKGFSVFGINQEKGDERLVRDFLSDRKITFPIAMDDGSIAHEWGVYTFPTSFLVGKDGVVRKTYRGVAVESALRKDIEEALQ